MSCDTLRSELAAFAALTLSTPDAERVAEHLWDCEECRALHALHLDALRAAPAVDGLLASARAYDRRTRARIGALGAAVAMATALLLAVRAPDPALATRGGTPAPRLFVERFDGARWLPVGSGDVHPGTPLRLIGSSVSASPARVWLADAQGAPRPLSDTQTLGPEPRPVLTWSPYSAGTLTLLLVTGADPPGRTNADWDCLALRGCDVLLLEVR